MTLRFVGYVGSCTQGLSGSNPGRSSGFMDHISFAEAYPLFSCKTETSQEHYHHSYKMFVYKTSLPNYFYWFFLLKWSSTNEFLFYTHLTNINGFTMTWELYYSCTLQNLKSFNSYYYSFWNGVDRALWISIHSYETT